jgi:NADPH:quinone reductase-like Zn-dependent oxidoreductase
VMGTGGVSLYALQFARMAGARVIATSSNDAKLERLRLMGADVLVNYKNTPDWDKPVRKATNGAGVDHIVEVGGAGTLPLSCKAVRRGGHIGLIGVLAASASFDPRLLMVKAVRLQGIYVGSREMFEEMNRAISLGSLRPVIDRVFEFGQLHEALQHMESGAHFGKICLRV